GDREYFSGVSDWAGKVVTYRELAEFFMKLCPGIYRSRHADGQHAARRNCFAMQLVELGFHLLVAQAERRTAATVQSVELVFFRAVNDGEQIAADAVRDWFHQAKRRVRRDGGIDRVAAALQNIEPNLRRQRHARADHAMPRENFRASRECLARDAIDLGEERRRNQQKREKGESTHREQRKMNS